MQIVIAPSYSITLVFYLLTWKTFKLVFFKTSMSPSIIFQLSFTLTRSHLLLFSIVPSQFESIIIRECIQLALGQMSKH